MRTRTSVLIALALISVGCASGPQPSQAQAPAAQDTASMVPAGFGTLKQDEFTMGLRSGPLLVKVTPLHEGVIRLAAPDTYTRLHALRLSRQGDAADRSFSESPELFMVSFFSYEPDVTFQPEDLQIMHQGRQMRAAAILSLTPNWGKGRLSQQEIASAIYAFTDEINYDMPITVRYGMDENSDWQRILSKLQVERGKISGRSND